MKWFVILLMLCTCSLGQSLAMPPNTYEAAVRNWEERFCTIFLSKLRFSRLARAVEASAVSCQCQVRPDGSLYNVRLQDTSGANAVDNVFLATVRDCKISGPPASYVKSGFVFIVNNKMGDRLRLAPRFNTPRKHVRRFS